MGNKDRKVNKTRVTKRQTKRENERKREIHSERKRVLLRFEELLNIESIAFLYFISHFKDRK